MNHARFESSSILSKDVNNNNGAVNSNSSDKRDEKSNVLSPTSF